MRRSTVFLGCNEGAGNFWAFDTLRRNIYWFFVVNFIVELIEKNSLSGNHLILVGRCVFISIGYRGFVTVQEG